MIRMVRYRPSEERRELVLRLLDSGLSIEDVKGRLRIGSRTIEAYQKGFKSRAEYEEHLVKQKGFKSLAEYQEHLAKQKGFKSLSDYRRRPQLMAMLKDASIDKKYGEDILEMVIEEYNLFDTEVGLAGRAMLDVLATATYGVLRKRNEPITLDDIAELFNVDKTSVASTYRALYSVVDGIPLQDTKTYIKRGIDELKLSEEVERGASEFFEKNRDVLRRFKPSASAAVCIYLQAEKCGERRTQKEIGDTLKVTEVTIRNVMRILKENQRL